MKTLCQYLCQYLWGSAVTLVCLLADYYLVQFLAPLSLFQRTLLLFHILQYMSILQLLSFTSNNVFSTHVFLTDNFSSSILRSSFNYGLPSMHFTSQLGLSRPGRNLGYSHSWKHGCWCASVLSRLSFFFIFNQFFIEPCFWKPSVLQSGDKWHSLQLWPAKLSLLD